MNKPSLFYHTEIPAKSHKNDRPINNILLELLNSGAFLGTINDRIIKGAEMYVRNI